MRPRPSPPWSFALACLLVLAGCEQVPGSDRAAPPPQASRAAAPASHAGAFGACGEPATRIHAVQGPGHASPMAGEEVTLEGVVVGAFQGAEALQGFYLQEEDAEQDADPATSEGIFVYEGDAPVAEVSVGEAVRVAGTVTEFEGLTELTRVREVRVCGDGGTVTPTELTLPLTTGQLEQAENMRVVLPQELVISGYHDFDRFGEIVLARPLADLARPFQPTAYAEPGSRHAAEIARALPRRRITLDDGRATQNPDPARHPNGQPFTLENRFRGGDVLRDVHGVLTYGFGRYRVQPTGPASYRAVNERPDATALAAAGGEVRAATFNVLNYFATLGRRGADSEEEFARQRAKIVAAIAAIDAGVVALIEIENDARAVADLTRALNAEMGAGTYQAVETGAIGPDEIRVALIHQPATLRPLGEVAVLDTPAFLDPNGLGEAKNRPALAQSFARTRDGAVFTAAAVHLKSKGSPCGAGDDDAEQGNCNRTRTLAARELLDWLARDPTGSGDPDVLILGDLNAYDEEDPVAVLEAGGFTDLAERHLGEFAYGYVFGGRFGHLDYALANASLASQATGALNWHVNADEPDILNYDTTFKKPPQRALYQPDPYRSSDHDPVVVGLDLDPGR